MFSTGTDRQYAEAAKAYVAGKGGATALVLKYIKSDIRL
jgi:hypothetical protein